MHFGVYNNLAVIQTEISRQCIAECAGQEIKRHSLIAEHFKADKERGNGTVCYTAKDADHANRRTEAGGKTD